VSSWPHWYLGPGLSPHPHTAKTSRYYVLFCRVRSHKTTTNDYHLAQSSPKLPVARRPHLHRRRTRIIWCMTSDGHGRPEEFNFPQTPPGLPAPRFFHGRNRWAACCKYNPLLSNCVRASY